MVWRRPQREDVENGPLEELYLRVSISDLVPFAAVQQVSVRGELLGDVLVIEEAPRTGVFDPVLLPRMQKVVAILVEPGAAKPGFRRNFGAPAGLRSGRLCRALRWRPRGGQLLLLPQPCSRVTTTVVPFSAADRDLVPR